MSKNLPQKQKPRGLIPGAVVYTLEATLGLGVVARGRNDLDAGLHIPEMCKIANHELSLQALRSIVKCSLYFSLSVRKANIPQLYC